MDRKPQTFANHTRVVPAFHYFTVPLSIVILLASIVHAIWHGEERWLESAILIALSVVVFMGLLFTRTFATTVQDRAIRAEENLRHYVLTGRLPDPRLTMGQIIALRFASDEEYPELCELALKNHLKPKEIKMSIRNWKPDYERV